MSNEDLLGGVSSESAALQLIAGVPSTSPPPIDLNAPAPDATLADPAFVAVFDAAVAATLSSDADLFGVNEPSLNISGLDAFVPVITAEPLAPQPESWRACTGSDIQDMIKAHAMGFVRTPGFTRADVLAFLASKGQ